MMLSMRSGVYIQKDKKRGEGNIVRGGLIIKKKEGRKREAWRNVDGKIREPDPTAPAPSLSRR
jgi:hypothetical protein